MAAILNSLVWFGLLGEGREVGTLAQLEEKQVSTALGGVFVSDFMAQLETLK
ncbi:hypothetical protein [Hydrogenophaga atypica]|uniref:Uncharacterized protein n=1 Tax=Hydrogenophaga atypica TaxID=249409 RepID=A0ABW2QLT3_9BURK